jgi:hypothetical protein
MPQRFKAYLRTKWAITAATLTLLITLVGVTPTAAGAASFSSQYASTTGAAASCSLSTWDRYPNQYWHNNMAQITCRLSDTVADSRSVYVEWWQDGFGHVRLSNTQGSGTTITVSDTRYNYDGSFGTAYFKVCRKVNYGTDNCSGTYSWRIS